MGHVLEGGAYEIKKQKPALKGEQLLERGAYRKEGARLNRVIWPSERTCMVCVTRGE